MRLTKEEIGALRSRMVSKRNQANEYYAEANPETVVDNTAWPPE